MIVAIEDDGIRSHHFLTYCGAERSTRPPNDHGGILRTLERPFRYVSSDLEFCEQSIFDPFRDYPLCRRPPTIPRSPRRSWTS